jgi:hypothetical protein
MLFQLPSRSLLVALSAAALATLAAPAVAVRPGGSLVDSFVVGGPPSGLSGSLACEVWGNGDSTVLHCMGTRAEAAAQRRCARKFITALGDVTLGITGRARFGDTCTGQAPAGRTRLSPGSTWESSGFRCTLSASRRVLTCRSASGQGFRIDTTRRRARRLSRIGSATTVACPEPERQPATCTMYGLPSALSSTGTYALSGLRWRGWGRAVASGTGTLRADDGSGIPVRLRTDELLAGGGLSVFYSRVRISGPRGQSMTLRLEKYTEAS